MRLSCVSILLLVRMVAAEGEGEPSRCLVYNHMPKSGGTSIKGMLYSSARKAGKDPPGLCIKSDVINSELCMNAARNAEVIVGYTETLRPTLTESGRKCQWFIMLRHPIERLISLFFYCNNPDTQGRRSSRHCGLDESEEPMSSRLIDFAKTEWGNQAANQMLFHYSANKPSFQRVFSSVENSLQTPHDWELLKEAEDLLRTYTAVGIAEHWDISMELFDATLDSRVEKWTSTPHKNASKASKSTKTELLEWAMTSPEIAHILAADILFYSYALSTFKIQTAKILGTEWT